MADDVGEIEIAPAEDRFRWLPISSNHPETLVGSPTHHRDPFDQLLNAQAMCEGATLVSEDRAFRHYSVELL